MQKNEPDIFYPKSQAEWRKWLQENHLSKQAVWLVSAKTTETRQKRIAEIIDSAEQRLKPKHLR
jgi:hypothetical protein